MLVQSPCGCLAGTMCVVCHCFRTVLLFLKSTRTLCWSNDLVLASASVILFRPWWCHQQLHAGSSLLNFRRDREPARSPMVGVERPGKARGRPAWRRQPPIALRASAVEHTPQPLGNQPMRPGAAAAGSRVIRHRGWPPCRPA
jgi:hypothetical protein